MNLYLLSDLGLLTMNGNGNEFDGHHAWLESQYIAPSLFWHSKQACGPSGVRTPILWAFEWEAVDLQHEVPVKDDVKPRKDQKRLPNQPL